LRPPDTTSPHTREAARPARTFWLLQAAGWGAFTVAMTFSRIGSFPLGYMIVAKTGLALMGLVVSLGLRALYRVTGRGASVGRLLVISVAASYLFAIPWTVGDNLLDLVLSPWLLGREVHYGNPLQLLRGTVYNAFILLAWSMIYFGVKHQHELAETRERALRAESLAHQARLSALRFQLNPHFLFNAMNAVSTLVVEQRNAEANRMLSRLADFLRLTLEDEGRAETTLADELVYVRAYLEIEQVRFGERLRLRYDVADDALPAGLPPLILQPLVENAVRHAVAPRREGGIITISARVAGSRLRLAVVDDGPGLAADPEAAAGVGLANVRARLEELYGERAELRLERGAPDGFGAVIELPYRPLAPADPQVGPRLAAHTGSGAGAGGAA
jgi:signal transduction histidine kinase